MPRDFVKFVLPAAALALAAALLEVCPATDATRAMGRAGGQAAGYAFMQRITELRYARGNRG